VRKLLTIVAISVVGAALWGGMTTAGAQTTAVFTCSYTLSTTALPAGGGPVLVSGTAPKDTDVFISVNGSVVATAHSDAVTGAWGPVQITITATSTIAVSVAPNYPATPCAGPATVSVEAATAALPRTGSNDTKPFVLVGATVLIVGVALVLAARRRERVHGRV
jgi:LPXTG-motif cell wall-anchored protein